MNPTYYEYINSEQWKQLKTAALKRDRYKCSICGSAKNLQVHHVYYPGDLFNDDSLDNVVTLCEKCHLEVHEEDFSDDIKRQMPQFVYAKEASDETLIEYVTKHIVTGPIPTYSKRIKSILSQEITKKYIQEIKPRDISQGGDLRLAILLGYSGTDADREQEMAKDEATAMPSTTSWDPETSPIWELEYYIQDLFIPWIGDLESGWRGTPSIDRTTVDEFLKECSKCYPKKPGYKGKRDDRIGERLQMKIGLVAEIIAYRLERDIDVLLEDGTLIRGATYQQFKNRSITRNNGTKSK